MWLSLSASPLPAAHAGVVPAQEALRASRLRSGMKVRWRRDCEGDCPSWRIASCRFDAVAHNSVT
jgi:hypothetical protein